MCTYWNRSLGKSHLFSVPILGCAIALAFSFQALAQEPDFGEHEIFMEQENVDSNTSITHQMTAQGPVWDSSWMLTTDQGLLTSSTTLVGSNAGMQNRGWDWQHASWPDTPAYGYTFYRVQASEDEYIYFFLDFRDANYPDFDYPGDFILRYNANTQRYRWRNTTTPGPTSFQDISTGQTLQIWTMKEQSSPNTDKFQPTNPTSLTLTNSGGHPKLTWRTSDPRASAKYKVYRGSTLITPTAISDTSYTDTQVSIGGGSTIYYKVRAVSGDGSKESPDFSNTVSTSGVYEDRPAEIADVAHRRYRFDTSYPNPFNPSTTLCYTLPDRSQVTLLVFNTLGQKVATLVEGEVDAGSHEAVFDAGGLPSGVYIARLIAGGTVHTTRMQLVR